MAKTDEATLRAIQKYKSNLDEIRFSVPKGGKEAIREAAKAKGYNHIQPYLIALVEADSGLPLQKKTETGE